jgi:putative hemolysin
MPNEPLTWILATAACLTVQGLFAMTEMACISYPRVRLTFEAAQNRKSAKRLLALLQSPTRLFGTTLLIVNLCLQLGAECARQLYDSLGWNPDLAPLTQAPLAILLAELSPLFAARRCPEPVARALSPVLAFAALALRPLTLALGAFVAFLNSLLSGTEPENSISLSREELQRALEETSEEPESDLKEIVGQLLSLRSHTAKDLAVPLSQALVVPANLTVDQVRQLMKSTPQPFVLVSQRQASHIVGSVLTRQLVNVDGSQRVQQIAQAPWFVAEHTPALTLLRQMKLTPSAIAIVLGPHGEATGWLSADTLLPLLLPNATWEAPTPLIERTFSGELSPVVFNSLFQVELPASAPSLSTLLIEALGHPLSKGDVVRMHGLEFTVVESGLGAHCRIHVRTLS